MKKLEIIVKMYFLRIENIFSPSTSITFDVTKEFFTNVKRAQHAWLSGQVDLWKESICKNSNLTVLSCNIFENGNHLLLKAQFMIQGGLLPALLSPVTEKGILQAIKKDLASRVLRHFPFEEKDPLVAGGVPVFVSYDLVGDKWNGGWEDILNKRQSTKEKLEKIILPFGARVVDARFDNIGATKMEIEPVRFVAAIAFKEDTDINKLLNSVIFSSSILKLGLNNPRLLTD
jgi:hypothetical protein